MINCDWNGSDMFDERYNILYESTDDIGEFKLREWDVFEENSVADILRDNNNFDVWMQADVEEVRN